MAKIIEIHDLPQTRQAQLFLHRDGESQAAPPVEFRNPLDASDYAEISWYFQEFLDHPFGSAQARADAVETGLRNLGRLLFDRVFGGSDQAKELFACAVGEGLESWQLAIISSRAGFLALPWELLNSLESGYLVTSFSAIVRRGNSAELPFYHQAKPTNQLNVLLVSPMPETEMPPGSGFGGGFGVETVNALEALDTQVELDCLRPPTFDALTKQLAAKPDHYHLVQFEGLLLDEDSGDILFEGANFAPEPISPQKVAQALLSAGVPIALCAAGDRGPRQPGQEKAWEALGSQMAQAGLPITFALPRYLPGSVTAERFLSRFYQSLVRGGDPVAALSQSRAELMNEPNRTTLAGERPFWDWVPPLVYQSQLYLAPTIDREYPNPLGVPAIQPPPNGGVESQLPAPGQYGLVGRRSELSRIERLYDSQSLALLTGNTGVGKTEVALGLARWLQKTGQEKWPGGVFYTSFEAAHPAGLERVIHEIGTAIGGLSFADLNAERQRLWVLDYLQEHPALLIWDGVENIAGFPEGSPGLLSAVEQAALDGFLTQATTIGNSCALLVTRNISENWLTSPAFACQLPGLNQFDRIDLAVATLEKAGVEVGRRGPDLPELLDFIEGHPLSIQVASPLLKHLPASLLLSELRSRLDDFPENAQEAGRDNFLTALMEFSWSRMSHRSRTHLPFLALFQRRAMLDILTHITQEPTYRTVMGEELGWGACRTLLRSALADGFLEPISPSVYQIHSALPRFYGAKLSQQVPAAAIGRLEAEFVRVYADTADYFMESLYENQDAGATAVLAEEGNLNQALGIALEAGQWENAQLLAQPLAQVYRMQKRIPELRRWRAQLLEAVGQSAETAAAKGAIDFWFYLLGTDVSESVDMGDLERAEGMNRRLLERLSAQPGAETDPRLAAVYHQFGAISLGRRQLDPAAGWFQRSLEIIEAGEDRAAVADDYFSLGQVRQRQRLYTEAKEWYSKALDIHQRLPDEEEMVKDYRALGLVTQLKFEHKEAESWYHRARDLVEERRDEETAVLVFHELGTVCHAQYQFDEAKIWYQQALSLSDRQGNVAQMATELHFLGLLEQDRGIVYEEAEEWYLAALERKEELGDRRGVGDECRQLGVLFHERQQYENAENWYHQAREIFEELGEIQRSARTYGQLGMIAEEQGNFIGALEWVARTYQLVTDYELPVLVQVKAHLARLRDKYGPDEFNHWWRDFTGDEPPTDLDVDASGIL